MRRSYIIVICLLTAMVASAQVKKPLRGFDGGMMVHTGYLSGRLDDVGYEAKGAPMGIGGVIRLHWGEHFRIGSEGYVSKLLPQGPRVYFGFLFYH